MKWCRFGTKTRGVVILKSPRTGTGCSVVNTILTTQYPIDLEHQQSIAYTVISYPWKGGNAMFSIANLLERAKAGANIDSDYRLAKVIGITHASVSTWRMGKSLPNEKVIQQLCAMSGDDPGVIAAEIQAARSKSPEAKNMWNLIAKRLAGVASTAFLSVVLAISLIAGYAPSAGATGLFPSKAESQQLIHRINYVFVMWATWLELHRRRITGFLRLCWLSAL